MVLPKAPAIEPFTISQRALLRGWRDCSVMITLSVSMMLLDVGSLCYQ